MYVYEMFMHPPIQQLLRDGRYDYKDDKDGESLLHKCCRYGDYQSALVLIKNKIDLNPLSDHHQTPLHVAVKVETRRLVKLLLDESADLNVKDNDGKTPLHLAASNGNREIFEWLIIYGAETDRRDIYRRTALHYACKEQKPEFVAQLLDANANIRRRDSAGNTALDIAFAIDNRYVHFLMISHVLLRMKANEMMSGRIRKTFQSTVCPRILELIQQCRRDLESLERRKVNGTQTTFLKLLLMPHHELGKLLIDYRIRLSLENELKDLSFGLFSWLLTCHYKRALRMFYLKNLLTKELQEILLLPMELIRHIFDFLDEKDMLVLGSRFDCFDTVANYLMENDLFTREYSIYLQPFDE